MDIFEAAEPMYNTGQRTLGHKIDKEFDRMMSQPEFIEPELCQPPTDGVARVNKKIDQMFRIQKLSSIYRSQGQEK